MGGGGRTTATGMLDSSRNCDAAPVAAGVSLIVDGIDCDCVEEDNDEEKEDGAGGVEVCCAIFNTDRSSSIAMTSDLLFLCVFGRSVRVCEDIVSEFNLDKAARPLPMPAPAPIIVFRRVVPLHDGFDA